MGILTLVCTILGFLIGSWAWQPLSEILGNDTIAPAISTFLITTLLGLLTHYITLSNKKFRNTGTTWQPSVRNIIVSPIPNAAGC
jgi:flagellar motor component MotA